MKVFPSSWTIRDLFDRSSLLGGKPRGRTFTMEVYQRGYEWGKAADKLLVDLQKSLLEGEPNAYMLNQAIVCPPEPLPVDNLVPAKLVDLEVIDGQQRTLTLLLIFSALRQVAQEKQYRRHADYLDAVLTSTQVVHHDDSTTSLFGHLLVEGEMLSEGELDAPEYEVSHTQLRQVYARLLEQVRAYSDEDRGWLGSFTDHVLDSAGLLVTVYPSPAAAVKIFERANDRGTDLSTTSLLKSMMVSLELDNGDGSKANRRRLDRRWKRMVHLLTAQKPRLQVHEVVRWHTELLLGGESIARKEAVSAAGEEAEARGLSGDEYLAELEDVAGWLDSVHRHQRRPGETVSAGLVGLSWIHGDHAGTVKHLPLLLAAKGWPKELFDELAVATEGLMVAVGVSGRGGQEVVRTVREGTNLVLAAGEDTAARRDAIEGVRDLGDGFAERHHFSTRCTELTYSNKYRLVRYVLTRVDTAVTARGREGRPEGWQRAHGRFVSEATRRELLKAAPKQGDDVDHIQPRSKAFQGGQVHQLGNLVLWDASSNRRAGNASSETKLRGQDGYRAAETKVTSLLPLPGDRLPGSYRFLADLSFPSGAKRWSPNRAEQLATFYAKTLAQVFGWSEPV